MALATSFFPPFGPRLPHHAIEPTENTAPPALRRHENDIGTYELADRTALARIRRRYVFDNALVGIGKAGGASHKYGVGRSTQSLVGPVDLKAGGAAKDRAFIAKGTGPCRYQPR